MKTLATILSLILTTNLSAQVCQNCGRNLQQTTSEIEITLNPGEELVAINGVPVTTQSTFPQRNTGKQGLGSDVAAAWGNPNLIQQALASARYRASRGISGHCSHDTSHRGFHRSGVGWSSNSRTPRTCFWEYRNNPNAAYVSVRGRRGYFATLLIE